MRMPSLASMTVAATALLGSSAAFAGPLGINLPNNFYFDTTKSYETLVTNTSPTLSGVFEVGTISNAQFGPNSYVYGQGGKFLMGSFSGFTLASQQTFGSVSILNFTGAGSIKYWVQNSDLFTVTSGQAADFAAVATGGAGSLFLSATAQPLDGSGTTLQITLNQYTSLAQFGSSSAFAQLDITGGAAAPFFGKGDFTGFGGIPFDLNFQGGANVSSSNNPCGPDFGVCGSNFTKGVLVPEPITLSLFGAGLAGAAAIRRRKTKKA